MTPSTFSLKNLKELISTSEAEDVPPTLLASISIALWLYELWNGFINKVIKTAWGPGLRSIAGACACAAVAVYVAGYTCGYWLRKLFSFPYSSLFANSK